MALDSCRAILPDTLWASENLLPAGFSGIRAGMTGFRAKMRIAVPLGIDVETVR